jgi:hypothetical protein
LKGKTLRKIQKAIALNLVLLVIITAPAPQAFAVVGQAEQYDPIKQDELADFQTALNDEQRSMQLKALEMRQGLNVAKGSKDETLDRELADLQRQLLQIPKRNRFKMELTSKYQYDSNINRAIPGPGMKNDSLFDSDGALLFDLSGKKTDLRFEVAGGKHWDKEFPEQDFWQGEERIRYRRRYFKKLQHSFQSRLARASNKTIELNSNKIRWDSSQQTSYNLPITRKLSLNTDFNSSMRYFSQEPYDQDSSWQATAAPSAFWSFTPKTRISLGYQFGVNRIRTKSGNTNTHEIHAGYFGRVTRKSSASLDASFSHQTPKSRDTGKVNTWTLGAGYLWQMTGKSQVTVQAIRSLQNTSSDIVTGPADVDAENAVATKSDSYFVNDSVSVALNSRLTRQLTLGMTASASHAYTKVLLNGSKDSEGTQFTFPFGITLTYIIRRWMVVNFGYTFTYRTGYEKTDRFRDHMLAAAVRFAFF